VTYSTSSLPAGAYSVIASYSGDTVNAANSSSAVLVTVAAAGASASSLTLTSSPAAPIIGNPVTLTAAVKGTGGTPTGNVYFLDGSNVVGSGTIASGSVSVTTSSLAVGVHSLTAYYSGDASFSSATSSVDSLQIYAVPVGDYAIASSADQVELNGSTGSASISIVTSGGFSQPITFSCSGLPAEYSCAFTPASITPNSAGVQTTQLLIVPQNSAKLDPAKSATGVVTALAGIGFLGLPLCWRFRRNKKIYIFILALAGSLGMGMQGCNSTQNTAGAFTLTVTATSLPITHSINVTVLK
jgi:hypothetical protein